jgi:hypothetical protein
MFPFSIHTNRHEFKVIINEQLPNTYGIGTFSIHRTADGRPLFVSDSACHKMLGYFHPSHSESEAIELAQAGVVVFDGDEIFDSLSKLDQQLILDSFGDDDAEDIFEAVTSLLIQWQEAPDCISEIPIKFLSPRTPVLQPMEYNLLTTGQRPLVNITINTQTTSVHSGCGQAKL